jgi:hypothetical protein
MAIEPSTIEKTAWKVYNDEHIQTRISENGFVLVKNGFKTRTFVGIREEENTYVVGKMWKEYEVVGRNSSRIRVHENEYVECDLYRMNIENEIKDSGEFAENLYEMIENKKYVEKLDSGYISGHRLTPLNDVLDDIFKWYDTS